MSVKKIGGLVLLVVGIVVLILSVITDMVGIGAFPGFGTYQILGTIVGAITAVAGLVLVLRK